VQVIALNTRTVEQTSCGIFWLEGDNQPMPRVSFVTW